jgi:hypothetical protein
VKALTSSRGFTANLGSGPKGIRTPDLLAASHGQGARATCEDIESAGQDE